MIAVDGTSGSGKSSTSRGVADRLGLRYLDTGAMYRVATLFTLRSAIDPQDADAVVAATRDLPVEVSDDPASHDVLLAGENVADEIRGRRSMTPTDLHPPERRADLNTSVRYSHVA